MKKTDAGHSIREGHGGASTSRENEETYLFGDLLAIARAHWVRRMATGVADLGYPGYRATDALLMRTLVRHGSVAISHLGSRLGVTRQAARKLVDGLEQRGYASEERDKEDARVVRVALTPAGEAYAQAVIKVITTLNKELIESVSATDLASAEAVLRATLRGDARNTVDRVVLPR